MRLFLDANVLFSACKTDGAIRRLLRWLSRTGHKLVVDVYVAAEANRNLQLKALDGYLPIETLKDELSIEFSAQVFERRLESVAIDPDDAPVMAAAIELECDALITGDKTHFGHLFGRKVEGVLIVSPAQAAESLLPNRSS